MAKLRALDRGIARCIDSTPIDSRKLVTDHDAFGYFAHRYGIEVIGAVIPSQTTQAQPSAKDLSDLVALIERERVKAVFPESSLSPKLAETIGQETGAASGYTLYGDTLGPEDSSGATYLRMEEANADAMVKRLQRRSSWLFHPGGSMTLAGRAEHLAVGYDSSPAIEGVGFSLSPGERLALLGPNGGGKTTLLRAILGELRVIGGELAVNARCGTVPQTERSRLDYPVSALDVALMGSLSRLPWWRRPGRGERGTPWPRCAVWASRSCPARPLGSCPAGSDSEC